jgi:hypothetical protein
MATIEKKYVYKVTRGTTYLGVLPNVVSEFSYTHNINSAGTQMEIEVADTADTSNLSVEDLQDEYGNPLQAEDGSTLTTERVADLVGDDNSKALIRNDNKIEVIEFSETYPNGSTVFRGFISKYKVTFGGVDSVSITVLSNGQDLNHYLVPGSSSDTLDQSQTNTGDDIGMWNANRYGQTFTTGVGITNISTIRLNLLRNSAGDKTVRLDLWSNTSSATIGGTPLGSVSKTITSASFADYDFTFATPITVTASTQYFFSLYVTDASSVFGDVTTWVGFNAKDTTNPYSGGQIYRSQSGAAWDGSLSPNYDMYFKTYTLAPSTAKTYTSSDPSTGMLSNLMAYYTSSGGALTLSTPSATGYSVTYTFNINTTLEGINKAAEFGPSNWYWYTNPATDTMYYKQTATTADHTMIKGRHINELTIEATKEQIANVVYFTGGEVSAGVNAYVNVNDATSLVNNRRGLVRLNDPKAKGASGNATGTIIANNYISGHNAQTYITRIEIIDGTYDITQFDLGEIVGFGSFGTFVDRLLLQIVGIQRKVDSVVLDLGVLPHRATEQMEQVQQSLEATQTVNNPTAPS